MSGHFCDRRAFLKTVVIGGAAIGSSRPAGSRDSAADAPFRAQFPSETFTACHYVRDGGTLPVPLPSRNAEIVIVAAGASGLTAGYRLRERDVLVLEKEPYVGGNAHADVWEGISYATGASFTHSRSTPMALYDELRLRPIERPASISSGLALYAGRKLSDPWGAGFRAVHPASAWRSLERFKKDMFAIDVEARREALDSVPFTELLRPYHPAVIAWFDRHAQFLGGVSAEISAYAGVLFARYFLGEGLGILLSQRTRDTRQFEFPGGLGVAAEALARAIDEAGPGRVETNATVYRIANTDRGEVLVSYLRGDEPVTIRAKACIVAAPKLIAGRIVTDLSPDQRAAMAAFRYIAYLVALIGFPELVIPDAGARMLDPMVGNWGVPDWIVHGGRRDPRGKSAVRAILPLRPERRAAVLSDEGMQLIAEQLADMFDLYYPGSRKRIEEIRLHRRGHNWHTAVPGLVTKLQPAAARPCGRVFFAHADSVGIISDFDWAVVAADRAVREATDALARSSTGKRKDASVVPMA